MEEAKNKGGNGLAILDADRSMFAAYPHFDKIESFFNELKHLTKDELILEGEKVNSIPKEERDPFWKQKQIAITFVIDAQADKDDSFYTEAGMEAIAEGYNSFLSLSQKSGLLVKEKN
ncbi:MAG: hypothetical protein IE916_00355 [Epsilonproteobacteria bacterium]|nr:hypothetical protein [Campylobacterota bacterium]